ncbi:CRISPR-associated Cas3 family helicase [Leucobacter luti]|uniref:CRISPR-associated Cas3 family helicase n=1 Tax=Leucobacter luti TaxID=340320 RepID=A0A4R6RZF9_9MICO|nr:CRISPR-associated helicase Cas3' [Leucobacter luti]TDP92582.1 CRISPR-associated Cas3 family helicase [Leucobacter luti]
MLTEATRSVWAKSPMDPVTHTDRVVWLPLYQHLDDTLGIAEQLWDHWLPLNVRAAVSGSFGSESAGRSVLSFLAGTHDVGKASPAFAVQVPELADTMGGHGLAIPRWLLGAPERALARHEIVSHLAVENWLEQVFGAERSTAVQLASVVGSHHGSAPRAGQVTDAADRPDLVGVGLWAECRTELIERAARTSGIAEHQEAIARAVAPQTALVLLTAVVILADWLASNEKYFGLFPIGEFEDVDQRQRVANAWKRAGFPARWRATAPATVEEQFSTRFGFSAPNATQRRLVALVSDPEIPRLIILEAAMGAGKTEAALCAAEILAERTGAGGIFIGLPTQATTDSMFSRVLDWAKTLDSESSVFLAHGKSALNPVFEQLERDAFFVDVGRASADMQGSVEQAAGDQNVLAHQWFADRRRGPLANLVIGTIDQALILALSSKHLMLRHLALANKVVIIDEAHAFSTYMSSYLDMALEWLGGYGAPVIILSATLPAARRAEMVHAYESGARRARGERSTHASRAIEHEQLAPLRDEIGYPSIVVADTVTPPQVHIPDEEAEPTEVALGWIDDAEDALVDFLREQLSDGGCAAVIHNTVGRVQRTAASLRAAFPDIPVIVAHSRFLASDRIANDSELLDLLGSPRRSTGRPRTCIVVATQVIEQSLDIDFDLMVTDLAPIDLILQRSGRLHRHRRGRGESERPAPLQLPQLFLTGVDRAQLPPELESGASLIYGDYLLLRTLAELSERTSLFIPGDISPLVQRVYGEEEIVPVGWESAVGAARLEHNTLVADRISAAKAFRLDSVGRPGDSLIRWASKSVGAVTTESRARATVRDGEDSLEVLVLFEDEFGQRRTAPWAADGGLHVPLNEAPNRALQKRILGSALRLPGILSAPWNIDAHIAELERGFDMLEWHSCLPLKGQLLIVFDAQLRARLGKYELQYSPEDGLVVLDGTSTQ